MSDSRPAAGPPRTSIPFPLSRAEQVIGAEYQAITETVQRPVVLGDGHVTVRWRRQRQTDRYGPVFAREVELALAELALAQVESAAPAVSPAIARCSTRPPAE